MLQTRTARICYLVLLATALVLVSSMAVAQEIPDDVYFVSYYSNAHNTSNADAKVRVVNPGTANGRNLCADIYVFDNTEQLLECCGCTTTPDDLRTISVDKDLTSNSGNGQPLTNGVIKVVSANANPRGGVICDPTGGNTIGTIRDNIVPVADLRVWATHIQLPFTGSTKVATTEEEFASSTLTQSELNFLQETCFGVQILGSGKGVCSCGFGR
ncbi:MAG TPA: hypothetical protein VH437_10450 [Terriglobales bacterium]|jgi:hypothetical protein